MSKDKDNYANSNKGDEGWNDKSSDPMESMKKQMEKMMEHEEKMRRQYAISLESSGYDQSCFWEDRDGIIILSTGTVKKYGCFTGIVVSAPQKWADKIGNWSDAWAKSAFKRCEDSKKIVMSNADIEASKFARQLIRDSASSTGDDE